MIIDVRWQKVFRDLWDNKARTLLVALAIAVGVFAFAKSFPSPGQGFWAQYVQHRRADGWGCCSRVSGLRSKQYQWPGDHDVFLFPGLGVVSGHY